MSSTYYNKISGGRNLTYPYVCFGCREGDKSAAIVYSYLCLRTWIHIQGKGLCVPIPILVLGNTELTICIFVYYTQYKGVISHYTEDTDTLTETVST